MSRSLRRSTSCGAVSRSSLTRGSRRVRNVPRGGRCSVRDGNDFLREVVDGDSLLPARCIPQILDPRSDVGERSREHRRRMVIGGRIRNRISRSGCWRRVKMRSGRMRIRVPIPPTVPTLPRSVRLCVVEIVVSVRIPPEFQLRLLYSIRILIEIECRTNYCECATSPIPSNCLDQRMCVGSFKESFHDGFVDGCCWTHLFRP